MEKVYSLTKGLLRGHHILRTYHEIDKNQNMKEPM